MQNKFTQKAQNVLRRAPEEAGKLGHHYIGTEHILMSLISQSDCIASKILLSRGLSALIVRTSLTETVDTGEPCRPSAADLTPHTEEILRSAATLAEERGCTYIGTEHILLAMLICEGCTAHKIICRAGISPSSLICDISSQNAVTSPPKKESEKSETQTKTKARPSSLSLYSKDLCEAAQRGDGETLIGREAELERIISILCRKKKNNPCLIGEPGVGKTAIVEGLAQRIVTHRVPPALASCKILSLDIPSMLAGAKYRGEFEERMKNVLSEVDKHPEVILFIDELHVIVGAGSAEGAVDAGNILKPALARGGMRVIGATTLDEYKKHIERDSALCRRFGAVNIEEPTVKQTLTLLEGIRESYCDYHGIDMSEDALRAAVELSSRYISGRFLPDKAIDLIDEAAARLKIYSPSEDGRPTLTEEHIAETLSLMTDIPRERLICHRDATAGLEQKLRDTVIGQDEAIRTVCSAVRRGSMGLSDPHRPLGAFIFAGRSGVGKSALAEAVARELFGSQRALIRFDMSEYMEQHSISKLIGSPPGYVGYGEGGALTEGVYRRPYCVLLFDGMEKAHSDIFNILMPIMEEGKLCDSRGKQVDFRNTVLIMTWGADASRMQGALGFGTAQSETAQRKQNVLSALRARLSPELLSRVDATVLFNDLEEDSLGAIAERMLSELGTRAAAAGLELNFEERVYECLARKALGNGAGARAVRHIISEEIEDMLAEGMVSGTLHSPATLSVVDGVFVCTHGE